MYFVCRRRVLSASAKPGETAKVLPEGTCLTFVTNEVDEWYEYLTANGIEMDGAPP